MKPSGVPEAFDAGYDGLRRAARNLLSRKAWDERSLCATDLVHEAAARVLGDARVMGHSDRRYVFAALLRAMAQVLSERARARRRAKRGGGWTRIPLDDVVDYVEGQNLDMLDLTGAIERMADRAPRQAEVLTSRYFFLMTTPEIAEELGVATSTVEADLTFARAWLRRELSRGEGTATG